MNEETVGEGGGMVYVFMGEGKGKTSAAIGTAVRGVGVGWRVGWVGWYKQESWGLSELGPLQKLGVGVWLMGEGFFIQRQVTSNKQQAITAPIAGGGVVVDKATVKQHKKTARGALGLAREMVDIANGRVKHRNADAYGRAEKLVVGVNLVVLDEVLNAVDDGLIDLIDLIDLISNRGKVHLVLTGRKVRSEIVDLADLVTECKKVKHPYDAGKLAVRGLDY